MQVCLVSPPTVTEFTDPEVAELDAVRLIAEHAPIGILTLAAVLEAKGFTPRVIDLNRLHFRSLREGQGDFCAFAAHELSAQPCQVFGFSTICSTYPLTLRLAAEVKRCRPDATILFGGPQASVVDVATLRAFPFIDVVVRGEAEETLPRVLESLSGAAGLERIEGITWRNAFGPARNPDAPPILELESLPLPAFHLYPEIRACRHIPLELGRGCPFGCTFCSTNDFFRRRFRLKTPGRMIEQMRAVRDAYGVRSFELIHDMFTVDRRRVAEFCRALLDSGEKFRWNCSARTDCIDDELIELMAAAGCQGIFFGIETGSARLQRAIGKRLDLEQAAAHIRATSARKIHTTVSLITGFPGETRDDLRDTVAFLMDAMRFQTADPQLHMLAPLAGTPIHTRYRDQLALDDVSSDISCHGWRQDAADRELIRAHPDIFPNFYSVPTPALDRPYVQELRDFVLHAAARCRWLTIALHQVTGDLLEVFDKWRRWGGSKEDSLQYYARLEFRMDLLRFAEAEYAPRHHALAALIAYENALTAPSRSRLRMESSGSAKLAPGVRLVRLQADYKAILRCLRNKEPLDRVPANPVHLAVRENGRRMDIVQLTPLSARVLKLCDGRRGVRQIARELASDPEVCIFALEVLRQQGLVASRSAKL